MNIYVDDDSVDRELVDRLRAAGHHVGVPRDTGLAGETDPVHFVHSIRNGLTLLTRNHKDFAQLHDIVIACGGSHPGILVVRFDQDKKRDMTARDVAIAIGNLESAHVPLVNEIYVLNHWR